MSAVLPVEQARLLAHAYLLMEQVALFYTEAGYPMYVAKLDRAMLNIGLMFKNAGMIRTGSRGGSRQFVTRNLALSLVETPKGV